jgi:TRAP-type C4-dicarboxylate transport system substrate-binding protein
VSISRLSGVAVIGALALALSGCVGSAQTTVGVDTLRVALLGPITPSQQAFVDRMNELSAGTVTLNVTENWKPASGGGNVEDELAKAVLAGDVDMAWVPVRSLGAIGIKGIDALEAPMLIQTHDQQRAVALGVPGELISNALRTTKVAALAVIPGPEQYPVASGAPLVDISDWTGKTVQVSSQNKLEAETLQTLGASAGDGTGSVADLVGGSIQATTADPSELVSGGATGTGPYLTTNIALWPRMSIVLINRSVEDQLTNRQHGFVNGAVVRSQDLAMADPDIPTIAKDACAAGVKFATAKADQVTAIQAAVQPVLASLAGDPAEAKLLDAIQDVVKKNAGNGGFTVPKNCRYVAPAS